MKLGKTVSLLVCTLLFETMAFSQGRCNCYYSTDCVKGRHPTCQLGSNCLPQGKNDGVCEIEAAPQPTSSINTLSEESRKLRSAERLVVSSALDAYFKSFLKAIEEGGGNPDSELLRSALNVRLSQPERHDVESSIWVTLDALMGWDFQYPTALQRTEGFWGNIREVDGVRSAHAIVDAARVGLIAAVTSGDINAVSEPLREFWAKNPNYKPNHLGRCYPHGHAEVRDLNGVVSCQLDVLQRVAGMLIDTADSAGMEPR